MKNLFRIFSLLIFISLLMASCGGGGGKKETDKKEISNSEKSTGPVSMGCKLDQKEFDKAEVFEPLAGSSEVKDGDKLPSKVSLLEYAPKRLSQGHQGSCTSWACAYAGTTILWAASLGEDPNKLAFSPAYTYNQITKGNCTGTHVGKTLELIRDQGIALLTEFAYDQNDCSKQPENSIKNDASKFKIKGFNRLTLSGDNYKIDMQAIKQNVAQKAPVVIAMLVGGSFYKIGKDGLWEPTKKDLENMKKKSDGKIVDDGGSDSFGGHAMCVIGYDDNYEGGAIQIMNSWGDDWGNDGIFWMKYKDFEYFLNSYYAEAYGLYPMAEKKKVVNKSEPDFNAAVGLVENKTKNLIPFKQKKSYLFTTTKALPVGTKFKIAVKNEMECYTYVFGQETDGSSYVLFPYTKKHSPYCGIKGTRVFPKDHSMQLDNKGKKDVMAVVFTKEPLDYASYNDKISNSSAKSYAAKLQDVFGDMLMKDVNYADGDVIGFAAKSGSKSAIAIVFEILKK